MGRTRERYGDPARTAPESDRRRTRWILTAGLVGVAVLAARDLAQFRSAYAERAGRVVLVAVVAVSDHEFDSNAGARWREDLRVSATAELVERWFDAEYEKHRAGEASSLRIAVHQTTVVLPAAAPPPSLRHLRQTAAVETRGDDVVVYVVYYPDRERERFSGRSHASARDGEAVVYIPRDEATIGFYEALIAHEICHLLGATDKYGPRGAEYPHGFAAPLRSPLYPQERAEIMALGIPHSRSSESIVFGLEDCVVGRESAREMGWRR